MKGLLGGKKRLSSNGNGDSLNQKFPTVPTFATKEYDDDADGLVVSQEEDFMNKVSNKQKLWIKILSARNIPSWERGRNPRTRAKVYVDSDEKFKTNLRGSSDEFGNDDHTSPTWNQEFVLSMKEMDYEYVTLKVATVVTSRHLSGKDRKMNKEFVVGKAKLPLHVVPLLEQEPSIEEIENILEQEDDFVVSTNQEGKVDDPLTIDKLAARTKATPIILSIKLATLKGVLPSAKTKGTGWIRVLIGRLPEAGEDEVIDDDHDFVVDATPIEVPESLGWAILEEILPCSYAKLHKLLFENFEIRQAYHTAVGHSDLTVTRGFGSKNGKEFLQTPVANNSNETIKVTATDQNTDADVTTTADTAPLLSNLPSQTSLGDTEGKSGQKSSKLLSLSHKKSKVGQKKPSHNGEEEKLNMESIPDEKLHSESIYTMEPPSLRKPVTCYETITYIDKSDGGCIVDVVVRNPDVPYGSSFHTNVQYVIVKLEDKKCMLRISARTVFSNKVMVAGLIESSTRKGVHSSSEKLLEIIYPYIYKSRSFTDSKRCSANSEA
eukprot:Awhi_evm1s12312